MTDSPATSYGRAWQAKDVAVETEPMGADATSGDPAAGFTLLDAVGELTIGIWEMTEGVASDTEEDEVFVVISGRATVEFLDTNEVLELSAGSIVRLLAGQRTRWTVQETLRKVYVS